MNQTQYTATKDKMVEVILKMTAEKKKCRVEDLQWKRGKGGEIHVRRRDGQEVNQEESSKRKQ